jgi:hypothetical protein
MTRPGHDTADTDTYGGHMGCGPTHDVLATMFFGGRRRRVYTELATRSGARRGERSKPKRGDRRRPPHPARAAKSSILTAQPRITADFPNAFDAP